MPVSPILVLIVSPCMGGYGGLESFVLAVADGVAADPNIRVKIIFKKTRDFLPQDHLLNKIELSGLQVSFCSRSSLELWREIQSADLVHLQNPCPDVATMARLAGKPLLINIINHTKGGGRLHQRVWKLCLHLAHQRFYISNFVRKTWELSETPWKNSQVIFPICKLSDLDPLPFGERTGFLFLARWVENKGLDTLVEAYANSGLDPDRWPLRLLGDGPLRSQISARVTELGLKGVVMPGFMSEQEKAEWIRRSRFVVIPPNTSEDFGLVAIEARRLGLPCLITRDGGLPEAAGRYCLACEPADVNGLKQLLLQAAAMNEAEYTSLASAAHQSLKDELVKPEFYAQVYANMIQALSPKN